MLNLQRNFWRCLCLSIVLSLPLNAVSQTAENVEALILNEQLDQALTLADQLLLDDNSNRRLLLQKGVILTRLDLLDQAEAHYLGLIALMPDSPEPMNNLGAIYQLQGRLGKAVRQLNETIKAFPNFMAAYENLGDTYIQIAVHQYRNGLKLNPDHPGLGSKIEISQQFQSLVQTTLEKRNAKVPAPTESKIDIGTLSQEELQEVIQKFMQDWAEAWSSQDIARYFDYYSSDFIPAKSVDLEVWKARKTGILQSAEYIDVQVRGIEPILQPDGRVEVRFVQSYESNRYKSTARKFMRLNHDGERFYIAEES